MNDDMTKLVIFTRDNPHTFALMANTLQPVRDHRDETNITQEFTEYTHIALGISSTSSFNSEMLGAYMHLTLDTSLIYFKIYSNCSSSYQNIQNYSKIFFCIFTHTCSSVLSFFCPTYSTKVCILLPPRGLIPSQEALTGSLAQPNKLAVCQLRR